MNDNQKTRLRVQVYGQHESDTEECINLMRKNDPDYISKHGPAWPTPTDVNRYAVSRLVQQLRKAQR